MGEAKKKVDASRRWQDSLSVDEQMVADMADRTFNRFVLPAKAVGMCYRLTFFLTNLLEDELGIHVEPVVGYVNDGTGDVMTSHAWLEINKKRTDIGLAITEYPDIQLPGQALILDRVVKSGVKYTYHNQRTAAALSAVQRLMTLPDLDTQMRAQIVHKEREHEEMLARAKTSHLRRAYLDAAPDGLNYARLAKIVLGK